MRRMVRAIAIITCLILLPSSFVPKQDHPPESTGHVMQDYLSKLSPSQRVPATSNEPVSQISTPTPSFKGHIPLTINLGKVSDLSFIYEGRKLAYVQFYSKDQDRIMRIPYEDYQKLAGTGETMFYGTFAPGDHGQAVHGASHRNWMQGKTSGLNKFAASVRGIVNVLRDYTQGMINIVRTVVLPAVNGNIVTPLRDYTQGMINKVRTAAT